jgi:hypothetical protein
MLEAVLRNALQAATVQDSSLVETNLPPSAYRKAARPARRAYKKRVAELEREHAGAGGDNSVPRSGLIHSFGEMTKSRLSTCVRKSAETGGALDATPTSKSEVPPRALLSLSLFFSLVDACNAIFGIGMFA